MEKAIERAGVTSGRRAPQALRASYDSELRANSIPTDLASKMTGHSGEMSRRHYTAIPEEMMLRVSGMYSPAQVKEAARKAAHHGAESKGTNGNGESPDSRKAQKNQHLPALAGVGGNERDVL